MTKNLVKKDYRPHMWAIVLLLGPIIIIWIIDWILIHTYLFTCASLFVWLLVSILSLVPIYYLWRFLINKREKFKPIRDWINKFCLLEGHSASKIIFASLIGLILVISFIDVFIFCCPQKTSGCVCEDKAVCRGETTCQAILKNPPWVLLAPLATAPALLLLWYWRKEDKSAELINKNHCCPKQS